MGSGERIGLSDEEWTIIGTFPPSICTHSKPALNCGPVLADGLPMTSIVPIPALQENPRARHMGKSALQIMGGMAPWFGHRNRGMNDNQDELDLAAKLSKTAGPPHTAFIAAIVHWAGA